MTTVIESLDDVSDRYDALFVDLWGCVHNGIKAFSSANESLKKYSNFPDIAGFNKAGRTSSSSSNYINGKMFHITINK